MTGVYRKVTFSTALEASEKAARAILRGGGLEPGDFAAGMPGEEVIRPEKPGTVLAFASDVANEAG